MQLSSDINGHDVMVRTVSQYLCRESLWHAFIDALSLTVCFIELLRVKLPATVSHCKTVVAWTC